MAYFAYALIWVAVSAAIVAGIYLTGSAYCLLAFLIPATISLVHNKDGDAR